MSCSEVRKDSLVILWKPPIYIGRSPVTGFYVDMKKTDAPEEHWRSVNEKAVANKFFKVSQFREQIIV